MIRTKNKADIQDSGIKMDNKQSEVDKILADPELTAKILKEKGILTEKPEEQAKKKALGIVATGLSFFVLCLFMISPLLQFFYRMLAPHLSTGNSPFFWSNYSTYVNYYQQMILKIHYLTVLAAVFLYIYVIYTLICRFRENRKRAMHTNHQNAQEDSSALTTAASDQQVSEADIAAAYSSKTKKGVRHAIYLALPFIFFVLFDVSIALATIIRGHNEYDLHGHPYMFESIWFYMLYPMTYFFCGMTVRKSRNRKFLLYFLITAALPLNILGLIGKWIHPIKYFQGHGLVTVFHNTNHYGYYLALVIIASALLFCMEKKRFLRIFALISMCIGTMALVINNTLGAFLAVAFSMIWHIFYTIRMQRKGQENHGTVRCAVFVFVLYFLIIFSMSFKYKTILTSFTKMFSDAGDILSDPNESDSAGSGRWRLWKGTVKHIPENPWTGFGVEGLLNTHHIGTPHNELLQYAAFFGIPAMIFYVLAVATVMLRVLRKQRYLSKTTMICFFVTMTYLASSFFGVAIYYTTPFLFIFLGLTYAEYLSGQV